MKLTHLYKHGLRSWPVVLDPITTLLSLLFVFLFLKYFDLDQYGEFVILTALFHMVLNHNWGFDSTAKSIMGEQRKSSKELSNYLYIICVNLCTLILFPLAILGYLTNLTSYNQFLFIVSAILQLSCATIGVGFLDKDDLVAERLFTFIFNNVNVISLMLAIMLSLTIEDFYEFRVLLISFIAMGYHKNNIKFFKLLRNYKKLYQNSKLVIRRTFKYYVSSLNANTIWTLNPIVLSYITTEAFIAVFSIYFRIAGILISTMSYFNSWAIIELKRVKGYDKGAVLQSLLRVYKLYCVIAIIAFMGFMFFSGWIIKAWLGEVLFLSFANKISLGVWLFCILMLMPINQFILINDLVTIKFILLGTLLSVVHVFSLYVFNLWLNAPLIAFPIGCVVVSLPICIWYARNCIKQMAT